MGYCFSSVSVGELNSFIRKNNIDRLYVVIRKYYFMIQEIIVIIIGLLVLAKLLKSIYNFFFSSKEKTSCGCSSCHCNVSKK